MPLFSPDRLRRLLAAVPAEDALRLSAEELRRLMGGRLESAARLRETALAYDSERELEEARRLGARLLAWDDPEFPRELLSIQDCPLLLYVVGETDAPAPAAAVVGSRGPTPYGRRMARQLGGDLAARGVTVVSGLARGIDSEAHEGALGRRGRTWAVLGSGLGRIYPPENASLARRIVEAGGCLLTERPLHGPTDRLDFLRRNRIVAGLCWSVVVVEGREHSGSKATAHAALEQQKELFAVPGPADSPLSVYPHELLRHGAKVACSADDVLATLKEAEKAALPAAQPRAAAAARSLSLEYSKILQFIGGEAVTVDALAAGTGLDVPQLSNILFEMELQGLVSPFPGQRYAKKVL